ncbi:YihY/virulence factor BrkB family protein [Vagococcus hydrophili]|uniref:YihY/virulence factor BrkB family protein n=1 Tax=Vagococcus hydrophili TaxID=2714947 RepID=A0A6G8AR75_9ENTE|nr:YihY/virulence factor BrkB family protein [Vagococcus hydrophili]QIL47442.1 YihY/virulence factor BrkB family protein [Vagococcus hydrophili]
MQEQEKKESGWKTFVKSFIETYQQSEVAIYAVVVTYYLLLSFFPLLIALGNILPFLNLSDKSVLPYIKELLPPDIYIMLKDTISSLLKTSSGGLLSISAIGTFWAMSKGIDAIRISLDKAYGVKREKFQFLRRLFSFLMVFILMLGIGALMLFMAFGQTILEYVLPIFGHPEEILTTFKTLKWPVTASVLLIILLMLYYYVPSAKVHFKTIIPGTLFTTVCWMSVTQFYGFYINNFAKRINSYGFIGTFIFFILWLNIAATLIIIGGVINVALERHYYGTIEPKKNIVGDYIAKKLDKNEEVIESKNNNKKEQDQNI